jgi:nitrogen fixation protein FixH
LGAPQSQRLVFRETADGHFVADATLPLPGQWELEVTAAAQGQQIVTSRRIFIR